MPRPPIGKFFHQTKIFVKAFCHSADFLATGGEFIPPQRQKIGELLWQL
jgi:hypothetical protein